MTTSQKYRELAKWAMKYALEKGCSDARVIVLSNTGNSFEYRDTQIDKLEQSNENAMSIHLFVDGRYASYSTNRLEKSELERYIAGGIEATRLLAKDQFRMLPRPDRYYKGSENSLGTHDSSFDRITVDEKIDLIRNSVAEIYGTDDRLISVTSGYDDSTAAMYMVSSNGFDGEIVSTSYSLSAGVSMKGTDDTRPSDYWYDSAIYWDRLQKSGIGKKAFERTVRKLGQEKISSGIYPMLLDHTQSQRLLTPVISALNGNSIQQKSSFLIDKLGKRITSEKFTLTDDPHIWQARGARLFDSEGVATVKRTVIDRGVLRTYYIDTYSGAKLGMEPTVQSPSILTCAYGSRDFEQILAMTERGIWVTGFNGGNSNSTTGDFSFGIEGFLVENGKTVKPVSEMNITGNLLELWNSIVEVGNDPLLISAWRIPSMVFDAVSFSGK